MKYLLAAAALLAIIFASAAVRDQELSEPPSAAGPLPALRTQFAETLILKVLKV
jgi:hypothetical protein